MAMLFKKTVGVMSMGFGGFVLYSLYTGNAKFYRECFMPIARKCFPDGENAHNLTHLAIKYGLIPRKSNKDFPKLKKNVFGIEFDHPVGLAAGFDKNGESVLGLLSAGFAFVEVGTVTPKPQSGNPMPRIFRLTEHEGILNRCGFNSDGHDAVYNRLKDRPWEGRGIVGINLGCNKTSADQTQDYVAGVKKFGEIADYLVINISSPNTQGLRSFQSKEKLVNLLSEVVAARNQLKKRTPILLKISPDEDDHTISELVNIALSPNTRVDGLIVSNTTIATKEQAIQCGAYSQSIVDSGGNLGGVSGRPLFDKSTACLKKVSELTKGEIPIIGVGGISDGEDAMKKIRAGAALVQIYTSFTYQGPPIAYSIAKDLNNML